MRQSTTTTLRRPSLDALRGLAALVVVIHHCLLVSPTLAAGYGGSLSKPSAGTWGWWLLYTPLHLSWAGGEAVVVFFVLSGLVLALPAASGRRVTWRAYYPTRLLRLYLPIAAAVLLAFLLLHLVRRTPNPTSSWWLAAHGPTASLHEVVRDLEVVAGTNVLNSALWSLQWEVVFSLLLPVFLLVFTRGRPWPRAGLVVASLVASSFTSHDSPHYLPMFAAGVLMARHVGWLDRMGRAYDTFPTARRWWIAAGSALLLLGPWLLQSSATLELGSRLENGAGLVIQLTGAVLVVWLAGCTRGGHALSRTPALRWLGLRSFSLYLVHEPIVVTVAYVLHGTTDPALCLLLALPLSLVAAEVFGRFVEQPAQRASKRVGRASQRCWTRRRVLAVLPA